MLDIEQIKNKILCDDCMNILKQLPDKCVDLVLTDPPYGYLDIDFDKKYFNENEIFLQIKRVLKDDSLICFSGRGDNFYHWNLLLKELPFKEEIIWNKSIHSTVFNPIKRSHETFVIRGNKKINKITIPFEDYYLYNNKSLINSIKRIIPLLKNKPELVLKYIKNNKIDFNVVLNNKYGITASRKTKTALPEISCLQSFLNGCIPRDVLNMNCDSRYNNIHPTQKPIKLYETLIKICSNENDLILDPFSGSGTTAIAAYNLKRNFICIEKDIDYYNASVERLQNAQAQLRLF